MISFGNIREASYFCEHCENAVGNGYRCQSRMAKIYEDYQIGVLRRGTCGVALFGGEEALELTDDHVRIRDHVNNTNVKILRADIPAMIKAIKKREGILNLDISRGI